jgi:hypothetical protein
MDLVSATTSIGGGQTSTATVAIDWAQPVDQCGRPSHDLGFFLALRCKAVEAAALVHSVFEVGQCAIGILTFLAPEAKLAALVEDADKAATAERLAADAGASTPLGKFVYDLAQIQKRGIISISQIKDTLEDAHSVPDFLRTVANLLASISAADRSANISEIALDVADLTGLGPCVNLLSMVVGSSSGTSSQAVVPPTGATYVYQYDSTGNPTDGDLGFSDWHDATRQPVVTATSLPSRLTSYRCVVLDLNEAFRPGDESSVENFLQAGGTVLALGEHQGRGFDAADGALNGLIAAVGGDIRLNDDARDGGKHVTDNVLPSPITVGVKSLTYDWATSVEVSGSATPLVNSTDDSYTLVAGQSVGSGLLVVSGDSNPFSDRNDGAYSDASSGTFVKDLCP